MKPTPVKKQIERPCEFLIQRLNTWSTTLFNHESKKYAYQLPAHLPGVSTLGESLTKELYQLLTQSFPANKVRKIEKLGLEKLHASLSPKEISALSVMANERLNRYSSQLIENWLNLICPNDFPKPLYLAALSVIRFYVPNITSRSAKSIYERFPYYQLKIHSPHLDSWFSFPKDGINIWVPLTRVLLTNGIIFYPRAESIPTPKNPNVSPRDWNLGNPFRYESEASSVLIFPGDIAHSSSQNVSQFTRVSATFRIYRKRPERLSRGFFDYYTLREPHTPQWKRACDRNQLFLRKATYLFVEKWKQRVHHARCVVTGVVGRRLSALRKAKEIPVSLKTLLVFTSSPKNL